MAEKPSGKLYSVAVPIGNSRDLTPRAAETLAQVDYILCEDTRKFLANSRRWGVRFTAKLLAHHAHNQGSSAIEAIRLLESGSNMALVTDAGTPNISDPGSAILRQCYEKKIEVHPIPGVSALTALLSISPLPVTPLLFLGFISPKAGRRASLLRSYANFTGSVVFYESVHRVEKLISAILEEWGNNDIFIGRELTKTHEETWLGSVKDCLQWIQGKKGEFVIQIRKDGENEASEKGQI